MQNESKGKRPKELNPAQTQIYNINGTVIRVEPKFKETGKTLFYSLGRMIQGHFWPQWAVQHHCDNQSSFCKMDRIVREHNNGFGSGDRLTYKSAVLDMNGPSYRLISSQSKVDTDKENENN